MKNKILSVLALTTLVANATISFTGAVVNNLIDENGTLLALDNEVLVLVVLDTSSGADGFSLLSEGSIMTGVDLGDDDFIGSDGNDVVIDISGSANFFGLGNNRANGATTGIVTTSDDSASPITFGDEFILYWFPDLATGTTTISAGDVYGQVRASDWFLPNSDGTFPISSIDGSDLEALAVFNTVQPIPEPSSTALLGLGGLALLARRRRA